MPFPHLKHFGLDDAIAPESAGSGADRITFLGCWRIHGRRSAMGANR